MISIEKLPSSTVFDAFITPIGFERRSIAGATAYRQRSNNLIGLRFLDRQELFHEANLFWCKQNECEVYDYDPRTLADTVRAVFDRVSAVGDKELRLGIDISSMSRPMAALLVSTISEYAKPDRVVRVRFVYFPAEYSDPKEWAGPITKSGPVIPELASWDFRRRQLSVIVGLGFEVAQAAGFLERQEYVAASLFKPTGTDPRFEKFIDSQLARYDHLSQLATVFDYDLQNPAMLFWKLESMIGERVAANSRVVILPLGPKLFHLCALLGAINHAPSVAVWRISGEDNSVARDRPITGEELCLDTLFT